jgi:hypothetical protein
MVSSNGVIVALLLLSIVGQCEAKKLKVLFVGNSYTYVHDLPGTVAAVAQSAGHEVDHTSYTPGGGTLGSTPDDSLKSLMRQNWDFVVMQDQSEIGGIPPGYNPHTQSVQSEFQLQYFFQPHIYHAGAKALLYMTWGRHDGDPNFPMYPDYSTMQLDLAQSYHRYLQYLKFNDEGQSLENGTYTAHISPCGIAWQTVYQDLQDKKVDPLGATIFTRLYGGDSGGHPSGLGQYLNAMVFFTRLFKESPVGISFRQGTASEAEFLYLQKVAESVGLNYTDNERCFPSLSCSLYGTCSDIGACECYKITPPDPQPCGMACDDMCDNGDSPSPPPTLNKGEKRTPKVDKTHKKSYGMNKRRSLNNGKI